MSSFLCFICHSTISSETSEDIRDKYREVVGMNLCPHSHLCYICCHLLTKLCLFKFMCLKRSLEYPVLFSEKGTINLLKHDVDPTIICSEDFCKENNDIKRTIYTNLNSKVYYFNDYRDFYDNRESQEDLNQYVELEDERNENTHNNYDILNSCHDQSEFNNDDGNYYENDDVNDNNYFDTDNLNDNYDNSVKVENPDGNCDDFNFNDTKNIENVKNIDGIRNIDDIVSEHDSDKNKVEENGKNVKKKKHKKRSFEKIVLSFAEQKKTLENERKQNKYLEADFKCYSCALGFLYKDSYQSHMMRHEESNGQFSCEVCGLRFASQNGKCMHVALHSELYKCNKCNKTIKRPHRQRHRRECWEKLENASCHLCGKVFKDSNCLQQHLKRFHAAKTNNKSYSCNVCGKTYGNQAAVRSHMLKHINKRFECNKCTSSFTSPYTLRQHLKKHNTDNNEQFYCLMCNVHFNTKKSLDAHLKNTVIHQREIIDCPICCRSCPNAVSLKRHLKIHTQKSNVPRKESKTHALCQYCGAKFKGASKLTRHLKQVCERAKLEEQLNTFYEQHSSLE